MSGSQPRDGDPVLPASSSMEPATYVVDAVVRLQRAVHNIGDLRLRPWNMSLSSYAALRVMASRPDLSLAQLSRRCFVRPQTMTRIASHLEGRGLIERHARPASDRVLSLRLTDTGLSMLAEMDREVNKINATLTQVLDDDQIAALDTMLRQCARQVEAELEELSSGATPAP